MGGAVPRGISHRALSDYASREALTEDEADFLADLMGQMDAVFFQHQEAAAKAAAQQAGRRP